MATTKTISVSSMVMSTAALVVATALGTVYVLDPDTDEMRPVTAAAEVSLPSLVAAIDDAECLSELNKAPSLDCREGSTTGGDGRELQGWWCGQAFFPATGTKGAGMVGACLSAAKVKAEKAIAEAPIEAEVKVIR